MKINSILLSFLLIFGLFSSQFASAQQMQVSASIDTTAAQVGDALWLKLTAQVPAGMAVTFPRIFADSTYAAVFDSISFKMDTVRNGNQIQVSQLLQVLAEKDGNHNLPALKFLLNSASAPIP
jgi:hypothetical protein